MQLFRYGVIGLASNLAGYIIYLVITYLGTTPKTAMSILYITGALFGFWGNRAVTFAHDGNLYTAGIRYLIAHTLGYFINLGILIVMVDRLEYPHQWIQGLAIFVVAAFLFLAFKFFVFKRPPFLNSGSE